jgi:hypothetical protein
MDLSDAIRESMLIDEGEKICPFRAAVGSKCVREHCAMWYKMKNDSGEDVSKCGLLMASYALSHLATVGMDVYSN